jgi:hypothetical protein
MAAWDESVFWPAFKDAGLLVPAVINGGSPVVYVGYEEPDVLLLDGSQSKQYMIEYQLDDVPDLAEGDAVVLTLRGQDVAFVVREPARVPDNPAQGSDGFWRRALLTRESDSLELREGGGFELRE